MTPKLYAKIKALADDPKCDPMTRAIALEQLRKHAPHTDQAIHPGLRVTPEFKKWRDANRKANPRKG